MRKNLLSSSLRNLNLFLRTAPHCLPNQFRSISTSASVNPDQVAHFNSLATTWWDPHGSSRLLHLMNPLRHDFIAQCLEPEQGQRRRYLDIGCGGGIFAESAARLHHVESVVAIDPSGEVVAMAQAHARRDPALRGKLSYRQTSVEALAASTPTAAQFDVVTLFEVIEHVRRPAGFLAHCEKFVVPGGWLVLSTMARTWMSWFTTIAVAEYGLAIVPRGTHDWHQYLNEEELRDYFQRGSGGWNSPRVMGVVYVPGFGWREVKGSEKIGNYFFAIRKDH